MLKNKSNAIHVVVASLALVSLSTISKAAEWKVGDEVVAITVTSIKVGSRSLATVPKGTHLLAKKVKGDWVGVTVESGGKRITGWVWGRHLAPVTEPATRETAPSARQPNGTDASPATAENANQANDVSIADVFVDLSLIPHEFGRKQQPFHIFGSSMFSIYSIYPKDGKLALTTQIPDPHGAFKYQGILVQMPMRSVGGGVDPNPVTNGYVWTQRTERIGEIDLSIKREISKLRSFDFDTFAESNGVVHFSNGYAVNLFGAIVEGGAVVGPGSEMTYRSGSDRRLPGRIISKLNRNGEVVIEETVIPQKKGREPSSEDTP